MENVDPRISTFNAESKINELENLVKKMHDALVQVRDQIERMDSDAVKNGGEFVESYNFKTGAFHALLGMVRGGVVTMALMAYGRFKK